LLRTLQEYNELHSINGHIAVGWLIVEDLVIVLTLVLIPALVPGSEITSKIQDSSVWLLLGIALGKLFYL
jgi:monovalent cation:H+ antiporter-2, CPA2 family